jgi:hypothetical protein
LLDAPPHVDAEIAERILDATDRDRIRSDVGAERQPTPDFDRLAPDWRVRSLTLRSGGRQRTSDSLDTPTRALVFRIDCERIPVVDERFSGPPAIFESATHQKMAGRVLRRDRDHLLVVGDRNRARSAFPTQAPERLVGGVQIWLQLECRLEVCFGVPFAT